MILEHRDFLNVYKYSFEVKIDIKNQLVKIVIKEEKQDPGLYLQNVLHEIINEIYLNFFKHSDPKIFIFYIYRGFSPKQLSYKWNEETHLFEK